MSHRPRPLSPHLQVYRPQLPSVMSIVHRGTGIFLFLGTLMVVLWVLVLAIGPQAFNSYQILLISNAGKLCLLGWSFSLFYHLANGIRHILWDAGWGFEIQRVYLTGWVVVAISFLLTGFVWILPFL